MKKSVFKRQIVRTLIGVVLAVSTVWGANAQGLRLLAAKPVLENHLSTHSTTVKDEVKEELVIEVVDILPEVPTVSFINKSGEVVAILYGDKSVLKEMYKDNLSKSYFLSAYGNHEVYLIK